MSSDRYFTASTSRKHVTQVPRFVGQVIRVPVKFNFTRGKSKCVGGEGRIPVTKVAGKKVIQQGIIGLSVKFIVQGKLL